MYIKWNKNTIINKDIIDAIDNVDSSNQPISILNLNSGDYPFKDHEYYGFFQINI